jgi:hypothetical protein
MKPITANTLVSLALCFAPMIAIAGSKPLSVAFFDFSTGVGKASFKALRSSGFEHPCWSESFVEITGIQTAYIEKVPPFLQRNLLLGAVRGDAKAAEQFRQQLEQMDLNGAYAFVPDPSGHYGVIYGIGYQSIAVTSSASIAIPDGGKLISNNVLSKRLCEASKSMD